MIQLQEFVNLFFEDKEKEREEKRMRLVAGVQCIVVEALTRAQVVGRP